MKNSIKFLLSTIFLSSTLVFSYAQRGGDRNLDPEKRAERTTSMMVESLSLNDSQAVEVKAINLKYAEKIKAARIDNKGKDREAMKSVRDNLDNEMSAELANILTPAQFETFKAKKDENKNARTSKVRGNRGERGSRGGKNVNIEDRAEKTTARMVENLSLDQEQATRIKAINLDYAAKMKAANEENKDKATMKAVRAELDKSKTMEFEKVLSPEQFKTYSEMKAKEKSNRKRGNKRG